MSATVPTLDELLENVRGVDAPVGKPNRFDAKRIQQREAKRHLAAAAKDYRRLAVKPANAELRGWLRERLKDLIDKIAASQVGSPDPLAATLNLVSSELRELLELIHAAERTFLEAVELAANHAVQHGHFPKVKTLAWIAEADELEEETHGATLGDK